MNESVERLVDALESDGETARRASEAWRGGADATEVAAIVAESGVAAEASDVVEALAEIQRHHAEDMAEHELGNDELDKVVGGAVDAGAYESTRGAKGPGGCSSNFYKERCTATVEEFSWCGSDDWCGHFSSTYTRVR